MLSGEQVFPQQSEEKRVSTGSTASSASTSSSVRDRRAFFESVGKQPAKRVASPPPPPSQVITGECKMAAYAFEASEAWMLSVGVGDIVQLGRQAEGWTECVLVTKDHPRHGDKGCVPTSYLIATRDNKLDSVCTDASNFKHTPAKKYKPVAKNLKSRPTRK